MPKKSEGIYIFQMEMQHACAHESYWTAVEDVREQCTSESEKEGTTIEKVRAKSAQKIKAEDSGQPFFPDTAVSAALWC